ncbi:transglycosylase SLT domain-containing protein [Clostridium sp. LBM24168]
MKAKGRVQGDEMLQLTEAGVPATKILQEQLGLTAKQVANIGDAGISSDKAIRALLTGMNKRFGGMMQNQAKTALGLMSTLKDTFENKLMNPWGQGLWSGIKPGLTKVADWLDKNDKKVTELGNLFKKAGHNVSSFIGGALEDSQRRLDRLMDSSQWKNADLGGKITLSWDKIVAEPFSAWWNGPGKPKINRVAADMGSAIGGTLGSGITSLLDALGGKEDKVGASGTSAGTAFTNAFLEAFDTGKIVDKLFSAFKDSNINALKNHDAASITKAGIMDYIVFSVLGGKTLLKGGGKLFNWLRTGNTAGKTASAAGTGAKTAESVSGIGKIANALKKIGSITNSKAFKALPVVGPLAAVATSAYAVSSSSDKARAASGEFGGIASGLAAAKLGGMAGSVFGPVGTGVGALIAGIAGTWAGHKGATTLYDKYNANSSTNKVPNGFSKSFNDLTQTNMKNLNTTKALDRSQTGITVQSNAYRGTLSNLLSSTGLTADSQGRLRDASGQYQGSLGDLLTSTGLVMDSQGNLLDANSLVQDSQVNLALSMDNLSQTVSNLDGNMGGIGTQQSSGIWGKVKNFFGFGDKTQSSGSTIIKNQQNSNSGGYNFLSGLTGKKYANGGITSGPEISIRGEAGTEAIIPLSPNRRNRGLSLWQQAGKMLGVRMFANGGIVGNGSTGGSKVAKATANVSTSIALGDNALSQFKQYGTKINTNLSTGIEQTRQIPNTSINKVMTSSKAILNTFSKQGHLYGVAINNDIAAGIRSSMGNVTSVVKMLTDKVITEFKNGFEIHSPSAVMTRLAKFIPAGVIKGMTSVDIKAFIKNWIGDIGSMAGGMSGNVSGWLTAALGITGTPMNWLSGLLRLTQAESGGNPIAVNPQAVNGEHATGLLQTLGSTFRQYAVKGLDNILNPIANAAAAINYIKSTYGSVYNTPLFKGGSYVGYATGTDNAKPGLARINERGWEFVDFTGGEKVLNHNKSVGLMERTANSLNRVKSAVSSLGIGNTESRDVPESSSNPMYYTSQPQMAMAGGYQGDINVDVENTFNDSTDVDEIVERATVQFARQLKAALLNKKK